MGFRRFKDRDGRHWEVRVRSREEWELDPVSENPEPARIARAPGYETDPFELSQEELQGLLEASSPAPQRSTKSPFKE
jgi:hypothetical protein